MDLIFGILLTTFISILIITLIRTERKGTVALLAVMVNGLLSSSIAISALNGDAFEQSFNGGYVFGFISLKADPLSAWFLLVMNFTVLTSILYGRQYMKHYENESANLSLHFVSFVINHFAMIGIYLVQNSMAFLCIWEIMAISSFLLAVFEHHKIETIKAGIKYLIQSHISIVFLMLGFIWVNSATGSLDFDAISQYTASVKSDVSFMLFLFFFIGFAIKAGFVPFHTWLPYAHPVAPAHVSGLMSGVLIKLGIYGILRFLLLIHVDYLLTGYFILFFSILTGIYGVMLAIVQHNIKKLLAYSSIENIGIIGIGIGIGCIGLGAKNTYLSFAGFAGALLHTLNHSLFKSLLFYIAGTVYQLTGTMEIEKLGGLIKKIPKTSMLFLVASLAICGLPPFNGFISEFLIYSGLVKGITNGDLSTMAFFIIIIFGMVIIGGMAMLCFTKAFGIMFLGNERTHLPSNVREPSFAILFPKYLIVCMMFFIGIFPIFFVSLVSSPVSLFMGKDLILGQPEEITGVVQFLTNPALFLIFFSLIILLIKKISSKTVDVRTESTWGCGYVAPTAKLQYTGNSYGRSFRKLIHAFLIMRKREGEITEVFPAPIISDTLPYDKIESSLIDIPLHYLRDLLRRFRFLQHGNLQYYILYGPIFILTITIIPLIWDSIIYIFDVLRQI